MPVSTERIINDLAVLSGGARGTFSAPWRAARDYLAAQAQAIGCAVRIDAAGNLHARPSAISWDASIWLSGSHLDIRDPSNRYDGVAGVIATLEALRAAREELKIAVPMELVVWAGNDLGMLGSRAFAGDLSVSQILGIDLSNGQTYADMGAEHGVVLDKLASDHLRPVAVIGYIEVHTDDSSSLWNQDIRIACVNGFSGRREYRCEIRGVEAPSVTTSMTQRRDALAGAAEMITAVERAACNIGGDVQTTVGRIECRPNAVDRIPSHAHFTIDLSSADMASLVSADREIRQAIEQIARRRELEHVTDLVESRPPTELDSRICAKLLKSASAKRIDIIPDVISIVPHDAAILAAHVPSAMLFIPATGGIGNVSEEAARAEDIALAATVLLETVRDRRLE